MIHSISKPKIPKNYRYVLSSDRLYALLINNQFDIHTDLVFWLPQVIGSILEVHYWSPNKHIPYNRLYIRAGVVLKDDIQSAKIEMADTVFPKLVIWMDTILNQSGNSTTFRKDPYFNAIYQNNQVRITPSYLNLKFD